MPKKNTTKKKLSFFVNNQVYWRNVLIATTLSVPLLLINLTVLHNSQAYISDDVIQQNIIEQWKYEPRNAIVGEDSFILKFPYYFILSNLLKNSPLSLFLTSFIFILLAILFLNIFQFIYHKDLRFGILISMLIVSYGGVFLFSLRTPNLRNLELTLALLTAWAVNYVIFKFKSVPKYLLGLLLLFASLQAVNDPYIFYVLYLPTIVVTYLISNNRLKHMLILGFWGFTYLLWHVMSHLIESFGLFLHKQPININPSDFIIDTITVAKNIVLMVGNWQIHDSKSVAIPTFLVLATTVLVASYTIFAHRNKLVEMYRKDPTRFWPLLYGFFVCIFCITLYIVSGMVNGTSNIRYVVCIPFALAIIFIGVRSLDFKSNIVSYLLIIAIMFNIATNLLWARSQSSVNHLSNYSAMVKFSQNNNATIGFSDYWDGNINTYYANGEFKVIPIVCSSLAINMLPWAANISKYPASFNEPNKFFIFINSERDNPNRSSFSTSSCSLEDIKHFFGDKITTIENINPQKTLILVDNTKVNK